VRAGGSERRPGACALERGEAVRSSRSASTAATQRARGSSAASARAAAFKCLCPRREGKASGEEREKREKESGERKPKVNLFDLVKTQDLKLKLEKF